MLTSAALALTSALLSFQSVAPNDLTKDPCLQAHAKERAALISTSFRHVKDDSPTHCTHIRWVGENLIRWHKPLSNDLILRSWMNSPTHRAVLQDRRYTRVGFARYRVGNMRYAVLIMGQVR